MRNKETEYGARYEDIARYIMSGCGMAIASEMSEDEHIDAICEALDSTPETILAYLSDATLNMENF